MKTTNVWSAVFVVLTVALIAVAWWVFNGDSHAVQSTANLAQIIGALALPVALLAIWIAKRDLIKERRVIHELEVLRDLAAMMPERGGGGEIDEWATCAKMRALIQLIPGSADLPVTRAALFARASQAGHDEFDRLCPDAANENTYVNRGNRYLKLTEAWPRKFRNEVQEAIEERVDPKSP